MIVTFKKIKNSLHTFRAQENGVVYQGTLKSQPSGRGTTLVSIYSSPDLGEKQGIVMGKFCRFKKGSN